MNNNMNAEDLKWRAREDAYTLARAKEIEADQDRLDRALAEAKDILEQRQKENEGLRKVAQSKKKEDTPNIPSKKAERKNPATVKKLKVK